MGTEAVSTILAPTCISCVTLASSLSTLSSGKHKHNPRPILCLVLRARKGLLPLLPCQPDSSGTCTSWAWRLPRHLSGKERDLSFLSGVWEMSLSLEPCFKPIPYASCFNKFRFCFCFFEKQQSGDMCPLSSTEGKQDC